MEQEIPYKISEIFTNYKNYGIFWKYEKYKKLQEFAAKKISQKMVSFHEISDDFEALTHIKLQLTTIIANYIHDLYQNKFLEIFHFFKKIEILLQFVF